MLLSVDVPLIEAQDSQIWGNKILFPRLDSVWCHWLESEVAWGGVWSNEWRQGGNICMVEELRGDIGLPG